MTDLTRSSLEVPMQIGIGASGPSRSYLPQKLEEHHLPVELDKKLDVLWSFIKTPPAFEDNCLSVELQTSSLRVRNIL